MSVTYGTFECNFLFYFILSNPLITCLITKYVVSIQVIFKLFSYAFSKPTCYNSPIDFFYGRVYDKVSGGSPNGQTLMVL